MKRFTHKKKVAAFAITAVLAVGGGGIAFAYFTSGGSGVGSAQVGTLPVGAFDITSSGPGTPLVPGNGPQPFDVNIENTSGQSAYVGTVSMTINTNTATGDAETSAGDDITGCQANWFTVNGSFNANAEIAADSSQTFSGVGNISMADDPIDNQDACQGAAVGIDFSA
jgi:hypothetical protein